jgi:hypothetical protein
MIAAFAEPRNLDFEAAGEAGAVDQLPTGWEKYTDAGEDLHYSLDRINRHRGKPVFRISSQASESATFLLNQNVMARNYRRHRVRLSAQLRAGAVGKAGLFMQIEGTGASLALDNMRDREIRGTADWRQYQVVIDVSDEAESISFGAFLNGAGSLAVSGVKLDVVDDKVPLTSVERQGPQNLGFQQ